MGNEKPNVLVVDDDDGVLRAYQATMRRWDCDVETADSGRRAIEILGTKHFDVIVTDVNMPEMDGLEFLRAVREQDPEIPIVLVTGNPGIEAATRAVEEGAFGYLVKPVEAAELEDFVRRAIQRRRLLRVESQGLLEAARPCSFGDRTELELHFASALDRLWMAYQPAISWNERRVFGYEALLRSDEPGMEDSLQIVDAAERLGRLPEVGRTVRALVANDMAEAPPAACILVKLHAADLHDEELFAPDAPLSRVAGRVLLEITERVALDTMVDVEDRVCRLRRMGYRLAVDDVDAGYAGLSSIMRIEPELAKIDASLVRGIDTDARRRAIARSLFELCSELGTDVLAGGVETAAERDALLSLGCDRFQGHLFAKADRGFCPLSFEASSQTLAIATVRSAVG
jgi:EAL domain-containing protein (putative c-di-GMP-specific phosphodiesterase class I)